MVKLPIDLSKGRLLTIRVHILWLCSPENVLGPSVLIERQQGSERFDPLLALVIGQRLVVERLVLGRLVGS